MNSQTSAETHVFEVNVGRFVYANDFAHDRKTTAACPRRRLQPAVAKFDVRLKVSERSAWKPILETARCIIGTPLPLASVRRRTCSSD